MDRLQSSINRNHINAITTVQMIEELITLRRYRYPPDMEGAAERLVPEQAEALSAQWGQDIL